MIFTMSDSTVSALAKEERFVIEHNGQRNVYRALRFVPNARFPKSLGMGGMHYVIRAEDGRMIHTNDLWFEKPTTEPVNAEFVHIEMPSWGESACRCAGFMDNQILALDPEEESEAERAYLAAAYERIKQYGLQGGGFSPSLEPAPAAEDAVWTDQQIAEYEAWLAISGQFPRMAPITTTVQIPTELEAA
jgi:hypothetical protein